MRIDKLNLMDIDFTYTKYTNDLYDSLKRIGLNFPIRVATTSMGYTCSDGNKRLSAIYDILKEEPTFARFQKINVIIEEYARTAPPYTLHNHH